MTYSPLACRIQRSVLIAAHVQRSTRPPISLMHLPMSVSSPLARNVNFCELRPEQVNMSILLPLTMRPWKSSAHLPARPFTAPAPDLTAQENDTDLAAVPAESVAVTLTPYLAAV